MQKSCFLGPTIFEIPQPNWYYVYINSKEEIEKLVLCTEMDSRGYNLKKECVNDFSTLCKFVFFVYSCLVCKKGEAAHFPWDGSIVK